MKLELAKKARAMGWRVYGDPVGQCTIELPVKNREVLLQKQESNKWLLISERVPQAVLKTKEASRFVKQLSKKQEKQKTWE